MGRFSLNTIHSLTIETIYTLTFLSKERRKITTQGITNKVIMKTLIRFSEILPEFRVDLLLFSFITAIAIFEF